MASQSGSNREGASAAEVQQLREELKRLREYKVVAEHNLQQMGFTLQAALKQGWVSKRAETRRKRLAKKKAAEDAKWAKMGEEQARLRKERKRVGLPVQDPTPSPSEAAYRERVAEAAREETADRLRNRVRRVSHQLLIAAAIRQQFREVTMADHSGHVVPGADSSGPLRHRPFDARSDTSLSTTEAMARSFRNWANREKKNRFHSRSQSPETVVVSSRTTGPEDSPSGSSSDSSFTDDDAPGPAGPGIAGPMALRAAAAYRPTLDEDRIIDAGEELGGLADLDFDDVSDETIATAYAMLAAAEHTKGGGDWADILAENVLRLLVGEPPLTETPPASQSDTDTDTEAPPAPTLHWNSETETEDSDTDPQIKLTEEVKQALKFYQISLNMRKHKKANQTNNGTVKKAQGKNKTLDIPADVLLGAQEAIKQLIKQQWISKNTSAAIPKPKPKYTTKGTQSSATRTKTKGTQTKATKKGKGKVIKSVKQQKKPRPPPPSNKGPKIPLSEFDSDDDDKGPSHRAPHRPAAPDQSVYDPTWWRVNSRDPDDGLWASEVLPPKQPTDNMETGFVTWDEQEARFPHLDDRLELGIVPSSVIFNPATVDTEAWDPLNRAITEAKTGPRLPMRLGPVTVHSLARWRAVEFGIEYPLNPVRLPDNPPVADKKRPLPSATLAKPKGATTKNNNNNNNTNQGGTAANEGWHVPFAAFGFTKAYPTGATGATASTLTNNPAAVASIRYPLKSPTTTSISKSQPAAQNANTQAAAAAPSGPPTPYPHHHQPETPSVSLYKDNNAAGEAGDEEEYDEKFEAFVKEIHDEAVSTPDAKGKRAIVTWSSSSSSSSLSGSPTKKRRTATGYVPGSSSSGSGSSDSEKENDEDANTEIEAFFGPAAKEFWTQDESNSSEAGDELLFPSTPIDHDNEAAKKSVRFDVREGPSYGMRFGARRALGRYGLTSSRRGQLGPYR
ncbi:hypothetical protein F4803DRAFT_507579 [Xylaria telfairii]|nr:hypothetical protein F4803DRAFT_507579 [Xylaria telfairii]